MDTGIIAGRYADALLKYTRETGGGPEVFTQVRKLFKSLTCIPELRAALDNPVSVSDAKKYELLATAAGEDLRDELKRFLRLVISHRRISMLTRILISFIDRYRKAEGLMIGRLITAVPDPELEKKLKAISHEKTGGKAEFITKVDPSIIGGFIVEFDGYRMDASIATQLQKVKRQFTEKNRRIV